MTPINRIALDRARDRVDQLIENQQISAQQRRKLDMTHKRTKHGNAKRPPSLAASDAGIDEWNGAIASALDLARRAEQRERNLTAATATDSRRFPAIKHGEPA